MKQNYSKFMKKVLCTSLSLAFILTWLPIGNSKQDVVVQAKDGYYHNVRTVHTKEQGIEHPSGLVYSSKSKDFQVTSKNQGKSVLATTGMTVLDKHGDLKSSKNVQLPVTNPINMVYYPATDEILIAEPDGQQISVVPAGTDVNVQATIDIEAWKLSNPMGITVDPSNGSIYVVDAVGPRLIRIVPGKEGLTDVTVTEIMLNSLEKSILHGIAFDSTTGHLHVFRPDGSILYELTTSGDIVATRDLSALDLTDPQAMVFAPSYDQTDASKQMNLFIADSGLDAETGDAVEGGIVEVSLVAPAALLAASFSATLINTINASAFTPPSPDSVGVEYIPTLDRLIIADSEVDEMPIYAGANLFETTLGGELVRTGNTLLYSNEPTGIAFNPLKGTIFTSDDDKKNVFEVAPGTDGLFGTTDDTTTSLSTTPFGSYDPEGLAFDPTTGALFISDGVNGEVYKILPGANGKFDGVSPRGDDVVTQFDTVVLGILDPEGIGYNALTGNLYIVGEPTRYVAEITPEGALVQVLDIYSARPGVAAGIGIGPSSKNPEVKVMYISDRGQDNDSYPNENDGKVFELSLPFLPPHVTITSPVEGSAYVVGDSVKLSGTATDIQDGVLTGEIQWASSIDGALGTGGTLEKSDLSIGTHTITATASNSKGLSHAADVTITVAPNTPPAVSITAPVTGASVVFEESVTFKATAIDVHEGDLSSKIQWSSSLDGPLGMGATISTSTLRLGTHTIIATSTDKKGLTGTATITITVAPNTMPVVKITSPLNGSKTYAGDSITFTGTSEDTQEGDLSSAIQWTSSKDGILGKGATIDKNTLTVGTHTIIATSTDNKGLTGTASVTITVAANTAPIVTITSPISGSASISGNGITFSGSATDTQDGDLSATTLWTSSIDGDIGTGADFTKNNLSVGSHIITATSTDNKGLAGTASVTITVAAKMAPIVTITSPISGSASVSGNGIIFSGSAVDDKDGNLSSTLKWTSSIDGEIGTGAYFTKNNLSLGSHTITATSTDSEAQTGTAQITVVINTISVTYRTYVQGTGWQNYVSDSATSGTVGNALRLEGIDLKVLNHPQVGIKYSTHIQNIGWQGYVNDGLLSGTSGQSLRLEAIRIQLTGAEAFKYDVYYRVHAQELGWLDWAKNGQEAGTAGFGYRMEAVQVKIVPVGTPIGESTIRPYVDKYATIKVEYNSHVQDLGWQPKVSDGALSGTTGKGLRLEGIIMKLGRGVPSGSIHYATHIQDYGWMNEVSDGTISGTTGEGKRLEAIRIRLSGEVANQYDVYYRVHCQEFGWLGWAKNGADAGSAGYSYRLEGIEVQIVAKGAAAPGSTTRPFVK